MEETPVRFVRPLEFLATVLFLLPLTVLLVILEAVRGRVEEYDMDELVGEWRDGSIWYRGCDCCRRPVGR